MQGVILLQIKEPATSSDVPPKPILLSVNFDKSKMAAPMDLVVAKKNLSDALGDGMKLLVCS